MKHNDLKLRFKFSKIGGWPLQKIEPPFRACIGLAQIKYEVDSFDSKNSPLLMANKEFVSCVVH